MEKRVKKYVPHLAAWQAVCTNNYAQLMTLLPDVNTHSLSYTFSVNEHLQYCITILETAPYTTTLRMEQLDSMQTYLKPVMDIRLYHDARMAEVLSSQHAGALAATYDYPNPEMRQKDEKERVNSFLSEWLQFCLKHRQTLSSNA